LGPPNQVIMWSWGQSWGNCKLGFWIGPWGWFQTSTSAPTVEKVSLNCGQVEVWVEGWVGHVWNTLLSHYLLCNWGMPNLLEWSQNPCMLSGTKSGQANITRFKVMTYPAGLASLHFTLYNMISSLNLRFRHINTTHNKSSQSSISEWMHCEGSLPNSWRWCSVVAVGFMVSICSMPSQSFERRSIAMEQAGVSSSNMNNLLLRDGSGMVLLFLAMSTTAEAPGACMSGGT